MASAAGFTLDYADGSANGLVSLNEAERVGPAMWEF